MAVQRGMLDRNASVPEHQRIVFRVGINLGDVIVEEGDIHGDGVNVAARLEALAEPGGICVSATVRDHIGDRHVRRVSASTGPLGRAASQSDAINRKLERAWHFPGMPVRLQKPISRPLNDKLIKAYAQEATRLRDLAASVTTDRLRSRLLEEADNQDRLALAARRGIVQPHPIRPPLGRPGQIEPGFTTLRDTRPDHSTSGLC